VRVHECPQTIKPSGVSIGFANFIHKYIVAVWLQFVHAFHPGTGKGVFFMVGMTEFVSELKNEVLVWLKTKHPELV